MRTPARPVTGCPPVAGAGLDPGIGQRRSGTRPRLNCLHRPAARSLTERTCRCRPPGSYRDRAAAACPLCSQHEASRWGLPLRGPCRPAQVNLQPCLSRPDAPAVHVNQPKECSTLARCDGEPATAAAGCVVLIPPAGAAADPSRGGPACSWFTSPAAGGFSLAGWRRGGTGRRSDGHRAHAGRAGTAAPARTAPKRRRRCPGPDARCPPPGLRLPPRRSLRRW